MLLARNHSQFQATGNPELAVDIAQMAFDGFLADGELAGDFAVAASFFDGRDDVDFARGKTEASSRGLAGTGPSSHRIASHPELTFINGADAFQQQLPGRG